MKLKSYLIDRFALIVSYIASLCLFGFMLQLQELLEKQSIQWSTWLYGFLLATVVFIVYLIYDYRKRSVFLNRIEQYIAEGHTLHDSLLIDASYTSEQETIVEAFTLLRQQYMNQVHEQSAKEQQQIIFMNQWIHQMKTPISVIELLLQKLGQMHREARGTIESIREENNRILHGLDLALHMARLEQFAKDYKIEVVNVVDVVREVINQHRKAFIQCSVYPKVMFSEEACMIASDRKWLSIAINQIVMNAIKYTKISQADKKEIQFQIEEKEQKVLLHISDNGIGIPKQDIKRVFEPFFTGTNGRKTREATGMGLYITKEICDNLHHGIQVQSTEGEGTTFTFQFAKDEEYHTLMRKMTKL
ncbi:HAMP domain-containing histidine kinase [Bacillus sp. DX4.1]|uniref:HAMP domain-containing histidine kinase n=1 Tax=Bacillus sp. DX4.1 TaxID=3055867 RepID=UPI0025A1FBB6|nr:HAMP domain-containing histidine kinase [Bacillus sp. DX4.1]MDM5190142.1 HAMP domain-containing histidine kinase [Bacillus sp. DX4.1]